MFNKMYDIITFGSATQDIHVKSKAFKILKDEKDFATGEGLCLALGSKIDVEDIIYTTGGGGTNTATTFARQGLKTAYCGAIGVDLPGLEVIRDLKHFGVDTRFLAKKKEKKTNSSIVIADDGEDRTILVYRGASDLYSEKDIKWNKIKKAKWFYLAPLSGMLLAEFEKIVNFAKENNIKVACNPSKQQLSLPKENLKRVFSKIDILFLNQEEASFLTGIDFRNENEIFKKIDEMCQGIAVMTKGGDGVVVSDGEYLYSATPNPDREIVDTTGAGDSFASGFLSGYIRFNKEIIKAIQLGLANSEANLSQIGAKTGLLSKKSDFKRVEVTRQLCTENNLCLPK
jgi:ribokinase